MGRGAVMLAEGVQIVNMLGYTFTIYEMRSSIIRIKKDVSGEDIALYPYQLNELLECGLLRIMAHKSIEDILLGVL
jgi:hypothetical protein